MSPEFDSLTHLSDFIHHLAGLFMLFREEKPIICDIYNLSDLFYSYKTHTYKFYRGFICLFIPAFILLIFSNPSFVKCFLSFIISATSHQSTKSKFLTPNIGYFLKKGIILSAMSRYFVTFISNQVLFLEIPPQSKYLRILHINCSSLVCCVS